MDRQKDSYRQYMIGQLQLWESKIAHLKNGARKYDGSSRIAYENHLRELERCNRAVFGRYADLLLAEDRYWEERRLALDAAARRMDEMLIDFSMQRA